jgi:hypothetical protein
MNFDISQEAGPGDQIADLEERIEELASQLDGCRKYALAGRVLIGLGAAGLLALMLGVIASDAMSLLAAIGAVIGGIVIVGSNHGTANQIAAQLAEAEALRNQLIGRIDLREVAPRPTLH